MSIQDLKEGDAVAVMGNAWYGYKVKRAVITRVMVKYVEVGGKKFNRFGGREWGRGDSYNGSRIEPWNEAQHPKIVAESALKLERNNIDFEVKQAASKLTITQIKAIRKIIGVKETME